MHCQTPYVRQALTSIVAFEGTEIVTLHPPLARYCGACLYGQAGKLPLHPKTFEPRCATCGRHPRNAPNAERPPWLGGHYIPGDPVLPVVGKAERIKQQELAQGSDKFFLSSLRVEDDPNLAPQWRRRSSSGNPGEVCTPDIPLGSVFDRLTDHRK